uniref:Uncharacterized protein n=1 Tax=Octopus bimaculoides TaxID=37653 RepID=A0A0L8GEA2_OCTBM
MVNFIYISYIYIYIYTCSLLGIKSNISNKKNRVVSTKKYKCLSKIFIFQLTSGYSFANDIPGGVTQVPNTTYIYLFSFLLLFTC